MNIQCETVQVNCGSHDEIEVSNNDFGDVFQINFGGTNQVWLTIYQIRAIAAYAEKRWLEAQG